MSTTDYEGMAEHEIAEVIRIPKAGEVYGITGPMMEAMEAKLQEALRIAGDTAPRLMYQLADVDPVHLDQFVLHHAEHFDRRVYEGGDEAMVAAVLIRHAFVVGVMCERLAKRGGA